MNPHCEFRLLANPLVVISISQLVALLQEITTNRRQPSSFAEGKYLTVRSLILDRNLSLS